MNKIGVDLIGEVNLFKDSGREKPLIKDCWGHANLKGKERNDSYYIYLTDKEELKFGEKSKAEFKFKFSADERFEIEVEVGQILELNEGSRKIGEFEIKKIVNEKLK